jgi:hypothetical protein
MGLRKMLLRVWVGDLPNWIDKWNEMMDRLKPLGYDYKVFNDYDFVRRRAAERLGVNLPAYEEIANTRKSVAGPCFGELFAPELEGYDFWGHCDQDTVFGRLDRFLPDELLNACDIWSNDPNAICGPFTLYRNIPKVNALWRNVENWQRIFSTNEYADFEEGLFSPVVRRAAKEGTIRFLSDFLQVDYKQHRPRPRLRIMEDGTLMDLAANKEAMMFHFSRTKAWPL